MNLFAARLVYYTPARLALIIGMLLPVSALAQQNPIGGIIGGLMNAAIMQAAQDEWQKVPEPRAGCLMGQLRNNGLSVSALIQRGIGPNHPNLAQLNYPCQRVQEEHDAEVARQRQEAAERLAQQRREEAQRAAEAKRIEIERVNGLKKIALRKNYRCDIADAGLVISSFCDDNLYRRTDQARNAPLKLSDAIESKLKPEDVVVYAIEKDDAAARRMDMRIEFKNATVVPESRFICDGTKSPRDAVVCKSYELVILDTLYADYLERTKAFDKKGVIAKKVKDLSQKQTACKTDVICLQRTYVDGVDMLAAFLKENQIPVATYADNREERRAAEAAIQQQKQDAAEAERRRQDAIAQERLRELELKAQEERHLAEERQRQLELKAQEERRLAETAEAARLAEQKRIEDLRIAREREEAERNRIAAEKVQQEAAARAALKQKWLAASEQVSAEPNMAAVQSCRGGGYGQKQMQMAGDLSERASIRQRVAQECACVIAHNIVLGGADQQGDADIKEFLSQGEAAEAVKAAFTRHQNECRGNLPQETLDRWKSN